MYPGWVSAALATAPPATSLRSSTVTDQPARASMAAATSPLGPDPITTASAVSLMMLFRSQLDRGAFDSRVHRDGAAAQPVDDGVDLVVGARGVVVEEQHASGSCFPRQTNRIVDGRVTHERFRGELGGC